MLLLPSSRGAQGHHVSKTNIDPLVHLLRLQKFHHQSMQKWNAPYPFPKNYFIAFSFKNYFHCVASFRACYTLPWYLLSRWWHRMKSCMLLSWWTRKKRLWSASVNVLCPPFDPVAHSLGINAFTVFFIMLWVIAVPMETVHFEPILSLFLASQINSVL